MSARRKYSYTVSLEWSGKVTVDGEDDWNEDDWRDDALDFAVDEALSSPAGYVINDYTIERVDG